MIERQPQSDWAASGCGDDGGMVDVEVVEEIDGVVGEVFERERGGVVLGEAGAAAVVPDEP